MHRDSVYRFRKLILRQLPLLLDREANARSAPVLSSNRLDVPGFRAYSLSLVDGFSDGQGWFATSGDVPLDEKQRVLI